MGHGARMLGQALGTAEAHREADQLQMVEQPEGFRLAAVHLEREGRARRLALAPVNRRIRMVIGQESQVVDLLDLGMVGEEFGDLAVVAMKVVHPGGSGQGADCQIGSLERESARMNMHKNARLMPQGQLLLVQRITDHGWTVGSAACAAGLSERQAYRWLARYRAGGTAALIDRSSAPKRCRRQVPAERVAEIERSRRQRLSGPAIARQLGMPVSTVGGILRRLGLGKLATLEPKPPIVRYERARPGELLHIDTKKLGRIEAVGHRITGDRRDSKRGAGWEYVHVCIDDASRLAYSEVLADERKDSAVPFLERAVAWFAVTA